MAWEKFLARQQKTAVQTPEIRIHVSGQINLSAVAWEMMGSPMKLYFVKNDTGRIGMMIAEANDRAAYTCCKPTKTSRWYHLPGKKFLQWAGIDFSKPRTGRIVQDGSVWAIELE